MQNAKISAVCSLADICFLHVLIWLISCIILSVCVSVFLVSSILHTVIQVSCSFVFVFRVCERLTTHSLFSFYCFEFLSLLEKLFVCFLVTGVRLLLTSVSSFQGPILTVTGYNIDEGKDSFVNPQMSVI